MCSEKVAYQSLKASDWNLEGAFDVFYSHPHVKTVTDTRHLEELYDRYKGTFNLLSGYFSSILDSLSCIYFGPWLSSLKYTGMLLNMNSFEFRKVKVSTRLPFVNLLFGVEKIFQIDLNLDVVDLEVVRLRIFYDMISQFLLKRFMSFLRFLVLLMISDIFVY